MKKRKEKERKQVTEKVVYIKFSNYVRSISTSIIEQFVSRKI